MGGAIEYCNTEGAIAYSRYGDNVPVNPTEIPFEWKDNGENLEDYGFKYYLIDNSSTGAKQTYTFGKRVYVSSTSRSNLKIRLIPPENFRITYISFSFNGYGTGSYRGYASIKTKETGSITFHKENSYTTEIKKDQDFNGDTITELLVCSQHINEGSYNGSSSHYCYIKEMKGYFVQPWKEKKITRLVQDENWYDKVDISIKDGVVTDSQRNGFEKAWINGVNSKLSEEYSGLGSSTSSTQRLLVNFKDSYSMDNIQITEYRSANVNFSVDISVTGFINSISYTKSQTVSMSSKLSKVSISTKEFSYVTQINIELSYGKTSGGTPTIYRNYVSAIKIT